ncbi:phage antirepressor KilAC domain-containing protein [Schlesneria sp. T3-172]|uniref:phage antirepressor KilAC domain-containing protein n=1 Tax=Schlesneria sphaerica TaxID=3373610 RepID=UPI0037C88D5D
MDKLIKIERREIANWGSSDTVSARDLYTFLQVGKDFSTWIKAQIERAKLIENCHFVTESVTPPKGGVVRVEYHLTIDAAKHLAMMSGTDRGCDVRDYFIECERLARSAAPLDLVQLLNDPVQLRSIILSTCDQIIDQRRLLSQQAPKVAALDRIATMSEGSLCVTDAAKSLGVTQSFLFTWLSSQNWIYRRSNSRWIGYERRIKQGFLEHKVTPVVKRDGTDSLSAQVRITPKGLAAISTALSRPNPNGSAEVSAAS